LCVCVCVRSEEHTSELQSHLNLVCRLLLESEEHTSELQSHLNLVCRLLLEKNNNTLPVHCTTVTCAATSIVSAVSVERQPMASRTSEPLVGRRGAAEPLPRLFFF